MVAFSLALANWSFRDATRRSAWRRAVVPGCVHRDLFRNGLIPDPFWGTNELELQWIGEHDWEYRGCFSLPTGLLSEEVVELVVEGLDTVATVRINGREIGRTDNMFLGYRWDVKRLLRPGQNEVQFCFGSAMRYIRTHRQNHRPLEIIDPVGGCSRIRKQQCQFGWDWGPRFVTAGIWRDLRIEAWSGNRLDSVRVRQDHRREGSVALRLIPELARPDPAPTCRWQLSLGDAPIAAGTGPEVLIRRPQLWWPNGQGAQPLYRLKVEATLGDGTSVGPWTRRIGLRTIVLDRHRDRWGESFQFVVNGRPVFAKGANWVPAHSFVAGLTRADYARDLCSAAAAHMNLLRAWGGGVYESEDFFDLCDELGLLVWQDFMFACTRYPGDDVFVASVRAEAAHQVRRLRHRACLALWCGNNEVFTLNRQELKPGTRARADYERVFHHMLPAAVASHDGVTPYWPSSPWRGDDDSSHEAGARRGDTHYWDVWHQHRPVKDYERHAFRFVTEFGMQSFSSGETQATLCPPADDNVFGPVMTNHQKHRFGSEMIIDYIGHEYRFPKNQEMLLYLSQLHQAECIRMGVEHYRRLTPRCMGALYWQLNDCWPVASWSSIEFTGRWKALYFAARRFFAPALVSAYLPGEEQRTKNNGRSAPVCKVDLYSTYDGPASSSGWLRWDLLHFDGRRILAGRKRVTLHYNQSVLQETLNLVKSVTKHGRDNLYLRIALDVDRRRVSEETVFLAPRRFIALVRGRTKTNMRMTSRTSATLTFASSVFQHRFVFDLLGIVYRASDNFFELYPDENKIVEVIFPCPQTLTTLRRALVHWSLVDSY